MRVESMAVQQALLGIQARRTARGPSPERERLGAPDEGAPAATGGELPTAVATRLADFFASDPGFAAAVSAHLPAARQASARDLATYDRRASVSTPRLVDVKG